jgi:hypothetical protein
VASLVFDVGELRYEAGGLAPPLTSPAPTSLGCPQSASSAPMLSSRPSLGTDARLQASALAVGMELFLLSRSYISP